MFKITATIIKPGGAPANWLRYSARELSVKECEQMFFKSREAGRSFGEKVKLENFKCEKVDPSKKSIVNKP
ncbi:DUF1187 family protein [Klebsiella sp. CN_Kp098]|uniref:DUF1187 family protein n=1 Tax=unclassified Klebsiella TaxID=2608929 RepID=UPI0032B52703